MGVAQVVAMSMMVPVAIIESDIRGHRDLDHGRGEHPCLVLTATTAMTANQGLHPPNLRDRGHC